MRILFWSKRFFSCSLPREFTLKKFDLSRMIQGSRWLPSEGASNGGRNDVKAFVRCVDGDERLRISLKYVRPESGTVKFFNFERLKDEILSTTFQRMANNIQKETGKKAKGDKKTVDPPPEVGEIVLLKDGKAIDPTKVTNAEAWTSATMLKIGETAYPLVRNHPTVILLHACDNPMANYPVPVKCHLEFADQLDCLFEWFVSCKNKSETNSTADLVGVLHKNWNKVGEGFTYVPKEADIGCNLLLKCTPFQKTPNGEMVAGEPALSQTIQPIVLGPKECPFERRQKTHLPKYPTLHQRKFVFTMNLNPDPIDLLSFRDILRVLSYNVLADCYTDMPQTMENFFPYCPQQFLSFQYRKLLLLKELPGYEADLMCLQEVDRHVFEDDYLPLLKSRGYNGQLTLKAREVKEGVAMFFRQDRFDLVELKDHFIGGVLDSDPEFAALNNSLTKVPHIREIFVTRSSVLQLAHLVDKSNGRHLLVANTHLYFHWTADNIRLLQAFVCSRLISRAKKEIGDKVGKEPSVMFCGDFNSDYRCGVYRLFTKGKIPGNFNELYQGGKANFIPDLGDTLQTDLKLFSASGTPDYTTFVAAFAACIDYIYAERDHFETVFNMPIYDEEEFLPYTACPNEVFGSDHFALVVDLKYKSS